MTHRRIWTSCAIGMLSSPITMWFTDAWHWSAPVAMLYASLLSCGVTLVALNWRRK